MSVNMDQLYQDAMTYVNTTAPILVKKIETLEAEKTEFASREDVLVTQLEGVLQENNTLRNKNTELLIANETHSKEKNNAILRCIEMERRMSDMVHEHKTEVEQLKAEIRSSCLKEMGDSIEKTELEKQRLAREVSQLQYELADGVLGGVMPDNEAPVDVFRQLQRECVVFERDLMVAQNHIRVLEDEKAEMSASIEELKNELHRETKECEHLKLDLHTKEQRLEWHKNRMHWLTEQCQRAQTRMAKYRAELTKLESRSAGDKHQWRKLRAEFSKRQKKLEASVRGTTSLKTRKKDGREVEKIINKNEQMMQDILSHLVTIESDDEDDSTDSGLRQFELQSSVESDGATSPQTVLSSPGCSQTSVGVVEQHSLSVIDKTRNDVKMSFPTVHFA